MKIKITNGNKQKQRMFLNSETILKYMIKDDEKLDTLIMCHSSEVELITTDFNLHEAIGSVRNGDNFRLNKLAKFFETVKVVSYENVKQKPKPVLKEERAEELRRKAKRG
ncbi:hypothetical protein GF323_03830 [Candidatus Woesearchaeota archaeon]|nr:hypothetical protein [Candidatus Woesearchaeota archaeon]